LTFEDEVQVVKQPGRGAQKAKATSEKGICAFLSDLFNGEVPEIPKNHWW